MISSPFFWEPSTGKKIRFRRFLFKALFLFRTSQPRYSWLSPFHRVKFPEKIPAICQPPLREIKSDIPLLVQHFISKIRKSTSIQASAEAEMEKCEVIFERTLSVNAQMVHLYWGIGNEILLRQKSEGWGAKIIERLSTDLRKSFPEMKGLSSRNLKYMRRFAEIYPDSEFVQQVAAQIPWFHNCILIDKVKGAGKREWYIQ